MDNETFNMIMTGLSGASGVFGSLIWFRMWVTKTDKKIDKIQSDLNDLNIKAAVLEETKKESSGALSMLQIGLNQSNERVGQIDGSLKAVWKVLDKINGKSK